MLNRADRRALVKQAAKGHPAHAGFRGVILRGGPLDGRIVTPTAPALHPEWWRSHAKAVEVGYAKGPAEAGRYVRDEKAALATAVWQRIEDAER
jgi:hypothetical protein